MPSDNSPTAGPGVSRRRLITGAAAAAAAAASAPFLAGCNNSASNKASTTDAGTLSKILPAYVPNTSITPDKPAVQGANGAVSNPLFLKYPDNPVATVSGVPGKGGSYTTMTPLWGAIPPSSGNTYYDTVNAALGATVKISPADGNTYGDKLPALFAAKNLPDWIQIPGWNTNTLNFGQAVGANFVDLTPYLAGDKIKDYPNLAAIPSGAWQAMIWNGKLYGLPVYPSGASMTGAYYFRQDLLAAKGINPDDIKTADDLANLGKELTSASAGVWAFDDLFGDDAAYVCQMFKFPGVTNWGVGSDGKLFHKYETEQIKEALNWHVKLVKAGYLHPDAVSGAKKDSKQRFWSGKVLVVADGTGAWSGDDAKSGTAANKDYRRAAFKLMSTDGKPQFELGAGAGMAAYLNKRLSDAQIKECLAVANYIAAPYGSKEWLVVNFGKEGEDYTMKDGNPVLTDKGSKEVATSFQFLVTAPSPITVQEGFVDVAKAKADWQADTVKYAVKPAFYGMNITVPPKFASLNQPVVDTMTDVRLGRKPISAWDDAVKDWRSRGGDELRKFYEDIKAKYGTGQ